MGCIFLDKVENLTMKFDVDYVLILKRGILLKMKEIGGISGLKIKFYFANFDRKIFSLENCYTKSTLPSMSFIWILYS